MHPTCAAPSIAQAPEAFRSHILTKAAWLCVKIVAEAELDGRWIGRAGGRGLVQPRRCLDVVLFGPRLGAARAWVVGGQSPWNRLSGVRFSWMTRMICWKEVIWAEAGAVRQSAASVKGNSWFMTFIPYGN